MLDDLIRQLQDYDPNIRRNAIIALGKTKSQAALRPLADVVLKDSDPELRELARKAGIYIRRELNVQDEPTAPRRRKAQPEEVPQPLPPSERRRSAMFLEPQSDTRQAEADVAEETHTSGKGPVRGKKYRVPPEQVARAKQYTEAALSDHLEGRKARAMKNLTEALSLNPNLINDDYFNNVASNITGLEAFAALESIVDPRSRERFIDEAQQLEKKKKVDAHMSTVRETTRTDFWFELGIYALILFGGTLAVGIVVSQAMIGFLNTIVAQTAATPNLQPLDEGITQLADFFNATSILTIAGAALATAITGVIGFFVQMGMVHLLATSIFGGNATFSHLMTTVLKFYNRWVPILYIVFGFGMIVAILAQFSLVALCPLIILVGLGAFVMFNTAGKIGQAYGFGPALGCITLILGSFVLTLLNGAVSVLALQATGLALESLFSFSFLPPG